MKRHAALIMALFIAAQCYGAEKTVNVLCYHRFEDKGRATDSYYITPALFEEHLKLLKSGYNVISMDDYVAYLDGRKDVPERAVVITIDDGYRSVYTNGFPLLKKYGMPATVYLYDVFFPSGRNALTKEQVEEMHAAGISFGSHSYSHPVLTARKQETEHGKRKLNDAEYLAFLEKEIAGSKPRLEKKLGFEVTTFANPYGAYSDETVAFMKKAGYKAAFSVVPSFNTKETDRFKLRRTMLYAGDKPEKLKAYLEKKPLKLSAYYPADGQIIPDKKPELSAVISDDSQINTGTVMFKMGRVDLKESSYNPKTKMLSYSYAGTKSELDRGTHEIRVTAKGLKNPDETYEMAWMFMIGDKAAGGDNGTK